MHGTFYYKIWCPQADFGQLVEELSAVRSHQLSSKMIVLHEIITHFSYIELIERKTRPNCLIRLWIIFKTLVLIILEMLLVLPALNFFIINMRNLMKATEAMYVVAAFSISAFMYVFLLFDKTALRVVFERMQTIVGKSK